MTFQMYAYADDLALVYASRDWKAMEDSLGHWFLTGGPQHPNRLGHRRLRTLIIVGCKSNEVE